MNSLKLKYWDHEGVNLHSRDIRNEIGPFSILQNAAKRSIFLHELSEMVHKLPFELFIVGINKQKLCEKYVRAHNPYEIALTFVMERVIYCMEQRDQANLPIIAEARGKNEDNALKAAFFDLKTHGTQYVSKDQFDKYSFPIQFHDKRKNIAGIQLADLCAHPSARYILKPDQPHVAYEVVEPHLYQGGGKVNGWKVFP